MFSLIGSSPYFAQYVVPDSPSTYTWKFVPLYDLFRFPKSLLSTSGNHKPNLLLFSTENFWKW